MILYTLCNSSKNEDMLECGLAGGRFFTGKKMAQGVPEVRLPHNTTAQPSGQDPEPERQENRHNSYRDVHINLN